MHKPAVIFDLDGTLIDSLTDIAQSVNAVLRQRAFPTHPEAAYRDFIGDGLRVLFQRALPASDRSDQMLADCMEDFQHEYGQRWNRHTRPFAEIPELLDRLTALEVPMAILSNKPHTFTCRYAEHLLSRWQFAAVRGQQPEVPRKPDPTAAQLLAGEMHAAPADIYFVGDTRIDMETAQRAGMIPVGALWGYRIRAELQAAGARHLCQSPLHFLSLRGLQ